MKVKGERGEDRESRVGGRDWCWSWQCPFKSCCYSLWGDTGQSGYLKQQHWTYRGGAGGRTQPTNPSLKIFNPWLLQVQNSKITLTETYLRKTFFHLHTRVVCVSSFILPHFLFCFVWIFAPWTYREEKNCAEKSYIQFWKHYLSLASHYL